MTKYLLLLILPSILSNIGAQNGATASYPKSRRKHVSHVFWPQDCNEDQCLESDIPQQKELQLRLLLNRLKEDEDVSDKITLDKRVQFLPHEEVSADTNTVPCFCHSNRYKRRDLGLQYYPRYLSEKTCDNSLCGSDSVYCCAPSYHTILVLKNEASTDTNDGRLPGFMRNQWQFEEINVTVSCVCEMKSVHG